jgi:hypothetical protein
MQWSIRRHLIALVVMVLVPTLVFSGFMLSSVARLDRAETQKDALHIARILAAALEREATAILRSDQTLATSKRLRDGDYEAFYGQARVRSRICLVLPLCSNFRPASNLSTLRFRGALPSA